MPVEIHRVREGAEVLLAVDNPSTCTVSAHLLTSAGRPNTLLIPRQQTQAVRTGLRFSTPLGYTILVVPRPTLSLQGLLVVDHLHSMGQELEIILYNGTQESRFINHGMRIAQVLVVQAPEVGDTRDIIVTGT